MIRCLIRFDVLMYLPTWGSYEDIFVEDCTQLQCGDPRVKFIQAWMTDFSSDFYKHVQRSYNTYMKAKDTSYLLGDPVADFDDCFSWSPGENFKLRTGSIPASSSRCSTTVYLLHYSFPNRESVQGYASPVCYVPRIVMCSYEERSRCCWYCVDVSR